MDVTTLLFEVETAIKRAFRYGEHHSYLCESDRGSDHKKADVVYKDYKALITTTLDNIRNMDV